MYLELNRYARMHTQIHKHDDKSTASATKVHRKLDAEFMVSRVEYYVYNEVQFVNP